MLYRANQHFRRFLLFALVDILIVMTVSAASPALSQRCYCDPYVDATSSAAANMSLFALLFPQSQEDDKARKEILKQDAFIQPAVNSKQSEILCAPPLSLGMLPVPEKPNVEGLGVDPELQHDVAKRNAYDESTSPHMEDSGSNTVTSSPTPTTEETVPVRVQLREVQRRMREQLEVHRGLGTALQQLDTLAKEVQVFRAEQRTEALVATLRERQAKVFAHILPCETNNVPLQAAVTTRPLPTLQSHIAAQRTTTTTGDADNSSNNNVLQDILRTYASSPRSPRLRSPAFPSPTSVTSAPTTTTTGNAPIAQRITSRVEIVRPPPAPQPYLRVRYIAVPRPAIQNTDSNVVRRESVSAAPSEYTEDFHSSAAIDSVKTGNGLVSSPASTRRRSTALVSTIGSSAATTTAITASLERASTTAISSSSSSTVRSTASELVKTSSANASSINANSSNIASSEREQKHERNEATVRRAFEAFTVACGNANRLVQLLTQTQQSTSTQTDHREHTAHKRNVLQRDLHDLRRLQHFTRKLQRNVHVLDVQRRLVRAKRRELVHARLLARARRELQRRPHARLHDIVDELSVSSVASSVGAELKHKLFFARNKASHGSASANDDEIEDEVSAVVSASLDSIEDEYDSSMQSITDEVIDDSEYDASTSNVKGHIRGSGRRRMSGTDSIEDEVDVQNTSSLSSADHISTVEDAGGTVGLKSVEEDFASLLASASVIDSVIDSIPSELPSHSATISSSHIDEVPDEIVTDEGTAVNITNNDSDSEVSDEAEDIDDVIESEAESSRSYTPPHTDTSIASSSVQTSTVHDSTSHSVPSSVPSEVEVESAATSGGTEDDSDSEEKHSTPNNNTRTGNDRVDLSELRVQLAQTQRRRRRALRRVQVPRFSELYDPNASSVSSSLLASSTTHSSSSHRSVKNDESVLQLSQGVSVVASVLAEQDAWKQREKELIRQLLA